MSTTPITQDDRDVSYVAVEGQTAFTITYKFQVDSDLIVSIVAEDDSETVLTLNVDYTVSGAGEDTGGTVTLLEGAVEGTEYRIRGEAKLVLYQKLTSANYSRATINTIFERCLIWITETLSKINVVQTAFDYFNSTTVPAIEQIKTNVDESLAQIVILEQSASDSAEAAEAAFEDALLESETTSPSGLKTLSVPDDTTISTFAQTLLDDTSALAMRATLGVYSTGEVDTGLDAKLDGKTYASRAAAVAATVPTDVYNISVKQSGGYYLDYREDTATSYPALTSGDGRKWVPYMTITPNHWADNVTPGTTDMASAVQSAIRFAGEDATPYFATDAASNNEFYGSQYITTAESGSVYGMGSGVTFNSDNRGITFAGMTFKAVGSSWAATDYMFTAGGTAGRFITLRDIQIGLDKKCSGIKSVGDWNILYPIIFAPADDGCCICVGGPVNTIIKPYLREWLPENDEFFDEDNYGGYGIVFDDVIDDSGVANDSIIFGGKIGWLKKCIVINEGGGLDFINVHIMNGMEYFADYNKDGTTIADNPSGTPATGRDDPILVEKNLGTTTINHCRFRGCYFDNGRLDIYRDEALSFVDCAWHSNSDHSNSNQTEWVRNYAYDGAALPQIRFVGDIVGVKSLPKYKVRFYDYSTYTWSIDPTVWNSLFLNYMDSFDDTTNVGGRTDFYGNNSVVLGMFGQSNHSQMVARDNDTTTPPSFGSRGDAAEIQTDGGVRVREVSTTDLLLEILTSGNITTYGQITGDAVQSSATDTTSGALLTVGAGGLLVADDDSAPDIDDVDAPISGMGRQSGLSSGTFPSGMTSGSVLSLANQSGRASQLAFQAGSNNLFIRTKHNGSWYDWDEIYSTGNIVGTVSEDGSGNPTGAIIESGGTISTGSYTKWADGTMIVEARGLTSVASGALTFTFPETFAAAPVVIVTARYSVSEMRLACCFNVSTTSVDIYTSDLTGDESVAPLVDVMVKGAWFS